MKASKELQTIELHCPDCGHNEAYVTMHNEHITARCIRCHKYIQHLSKKVYREKAYPKESALRQQIKELIELWCSHYEKEPHEGWKRLYRLFERQHGIDLFNWSNPGKKKRKITGLDMALEMGVIAQLHDVAVTFFMELEQNPPCVETELVVYPDELRQRINQMIPDSLLQAMAKVRLDPISLYHLIKDHIIIYQAEQFYSNRKEGKKNNG